MTPQELIANKDYKFHHTATRRDYVSRKNPEGIVEEYDGKYGKGYVIVRPRFDTSMYVSLFYYVETDEVRERRIGNERDALLRKRHQIDVKRAELVIKASDLIADGVLPDGKHRRLLDAVDKLRKYEQEIKDIDKQIKKLN